MIKAHESIQIRMVSLSRVFESTNRIKAFAASKCSGVLNFEAAQSSVMGRIPVTIHNHRLDDRSRIAIQKQLEFAAI